MKRQEAPAEQTGTASGVAHFCGSCAWGAWRLFVTTLGIAMIAVALLIFLLQRGPVSLGWLADWVETRVNQEQTEASLEIGDLVVRLPRGQLRPVLEFRNVFVRTSDGAPIAAAPALRAQFAARDLLAGEVRPVRLILIGPEARLIHTLNGRYRFGLGYFGSVDVTEQLAGGATATPPRARAVTEDSGMSAMARVVQAFLEEGPPVAGLEALREVEILDARLTYLHMQSARLWETTDTDLTITKTAEGVTAELSLSISEDQRPGAELTANAERRFGQAGTEVSLQLGRLRTLDLAEQVPGLEALTLVDAEVSASFDGALDDAGDLAWIEGSVAALDGRLSGIGDAGERFEELLFSFRHVPGSDRVYFDELRLRAKAATALLAGFADFERDADGAVKAVLGQIDVDRLAFDLPAVFSERISFDGGHVLGRIDLDSFLVEIAEARLDDKDLSLMVQGSTRPVGDGWLATMRASGRKIAVEELVSHWPLPAAVNARSWLAENLIDGMVDELVAHLRIDQGEPQLNLDFKFSQVSARYLGPMTPITEASGRGHLTLHDFYLFVDRGQVYDSEDERIVIDGSRIEITELWGEVTPGDIHLEARGQTARMLRLVNEEPLGLVARLGLDPATIEGDAELSGRIRFPLLNDLLIEEVDVSVETRLSAAALPLDFIGWSGLRATSPALSLSATTAGMRIRGPVTVSGQSVELDWRENYGATPGRREIAAITRVTPRSLATFAQAFPGFEAGSLRVKATVRQTGAGPLDLDLDADLADADLALPMIGWRKGQGQPGRLTTKVRLGERIELRDTSFDAAGLHGRGNITLDKSGDLLSARLSRLRLGQDIDAAIGVEQAGGGYTLDIDGKLLDLTLLDRLEEGGADSGEPTPITGRFALDTVRLTERFDLRAAAGTLTRDATGKLDLRAGGRLNGEAGVRGRVRQDPGGPLDLVVRSSQTGAVLRSLGVVDDGRGGEMVLRASVPPGPEPMQGVLEVKDLIIGEDKTFQIILREGTEGGDSQGLVSSALRFKKVRVPFTYQDEVISIRNAIATGPSLALKLEGSIDEGRGQVDIAGLASPAYAISSALDNIPLLGRLLTGGEGEGILAITFTVTGNVDDPKIRVNPLSAITPGFISKLFSGRGKPPDEDFLDQIERSPAEER